MTGKCRRLAILALLATGGLLSTACDGDFISEEARRSLASFITGIVSTAVDGTIGP